MGGASGGTVSLRDCFLRFSLLPYLELKLDDIVLPAPEPHSTSVTLQTLHFPDKIAISAWYRVVR